DSDARRADRGSGLFEELLEGLARNLATGGTDRRLGETEEPDAGERDLIGQGELKAAEAHEQKAPAAQPRRTGGLKQPHQGVEAEAEREQRQRLPPELRGQLEIEAIGGDARGV